MKDQLQTIRAALLWSIKPSAGPATRQHINKSLTALDEIEKMVGSQEPVAWVECDGELVWNNREAAIGRNLYTAAPPAQQYEAGDVASAAAQGFRDGVASVTQQEPVAWAMPKGDGTFIDVITPAEHARDEGSYTVPLFAAPVAQQPQARPDFTDEWTGYLKDGETPFERFLRERKDMQSVLDMYQRVLEENERLKAQQPRQCGLCGSDEAFAGACGGGKNNPRALCYEPVAQQPQAKPHKPLFADLIAQHPGLREELLEMDKQPQTEAVPVVDRVYEAAKRLVDHADFQLGGVLIAKSKARDIPSNAASKVKARHLASLRDALAKTPHQAEAVRYTRADLDRAYSAGFVEGERLAIQQAEAVPPDVVRDAERWRTFLATRPANTHAVINDAIDAAMAKGEKS